MISFKATNKLTGDEIILNWIIKTDPIHDFNQFTFIWAAANGYLDHVKYFALERGVNVNSYDGKALKMAALRNKVAVIKFLLENGANIILMDDETMEDIKRRDNREVLKILKEHIKSITMKE